MTSPAPGSAPFSAPSARLYLLLVLTTLNAFNHLDRQLMSILLEPVRREFDLGDIALGLLSGPAFAVLYSILGFPAAIWAARHGRIKLLALAAITWGTMTAACGLARSFGFLLLGRLGVGIGEAGGTPAAQALISDLFPTGRRATAMSIFTSGLNAGVFLAFMAGGLMAQAYGWRTAFVAAGAATVLLGCLLRLTVREPVPGGERTRGRQATASAMFAETWRAIRVDPALRHLCCGTVLTSIASYGALAWLPSFLVRAHGLPVASVGLFLALVIGIGGAACTWLGGALSDRLRKRDIRWSLGFVALVLLAAKPLSAAAYLVDSTRLALALFVVPCMVGSIFLGPSFAILHDRIEPLLRPLATAIFLGFINLFGLGLGPLLVGAMSERLFADAGPYALGYALVVMQILGVWGVVHYSLAGKRLALAPTR